jgi:hypothetical protein
MLTESTARTPKTKGTAAMSTRTDSANCLYITSSIWNALGYYASTIFGAAAPDGLEAATKALLAHKLIRACGESFEPTSSGDRLLAHRAEMENPERVPETMWVTGAGGGVVSGQKLPEYQICGYNRAPSWWL